MKEFSLLRVRKQEKAEGATARQELPLMRRFRLASERQALDQNRAEAGKRFAVKPRVGFEAQRSDQFECRRAQRVNNCRNLLATGGRPASGEAFALRAQFMALGIQGVNAPGRMRNSAIGRRIKRRPGETDGASRLREFQSERCRDIAGIDLR